MPQALAKLDPHPESAFPPRKRRSLRRQFFMTVLLFLLVGSIGAYWFITDPDRVRTMAESYLSKIIGGRVEVRKASLSLFEGLRLEGIRIYVDDLDRPDSRIFTARTFMVRTDLRALLSGRLEASQIMALDPHVHLCEDLDAADGKRWNYQRLASLRRRTRSSTSDRPIILPEILLRAGLIQYSRISRGNHRTLGTMAIDGLLTPYTRLTHSDDANRYLFELDSRAPGQPLGPHLSGVLDMDGPSVSASLQNFEFNDAIRAMLPAQVQAWWEAHQLAGRIRIPRFEFSPAKDGSPQAFRIEVQLDDVRLAILPEELLDHAEYRELCLLRPGIRVGGLVEIGWVSRTELLEKTLQPQPITLTGISGRLIFTPHQIRLVGVHGKVEGNPIALDGAVFGYSPDAPASIRLVANSITIPRLPRYLHSLPLAVRKIYSDFKPFGRVGLYFEFNRKQGDKLHATGQVSVHDATFCFDEFPYPLRKVRGTVTLGPDPNTGKDRVDLINLRGYGLEGTRNADNAITLNGWISPVEKGSAVQVHVTGPRVWLDPAVRAALPPDAREVMALFDIRDRSGAGQKTPLLAPMEVRGSLDARIRRPPGRKRKVMVEVDLNIDDGRGEFATFPYPLRNITGQVYVRHRHTEVRNLTSRNGDALLRVDGSVDYGPERPVEPNLTITARNVPIDDDLLYALHPQQRQWLKKVDLAGTIDVDGRVFLPNDAPDSRQTDFDLKIALRDGTLWPVEDTHAITQATADLHLNRSQLTIHHLAGKRGSGKIVGRGSIAWPEDQPQLDLMADLTHIALDKTFYQLIPKAAQKSWDQLRPDGTIDLNIVYRDGIAKTHASSKPASATESYQVTIRPRALTVKPAAFPWPMEHVAGTALVSPDHTLLRDVILKHGQSVVRISGTGTHGELPQWELALSGDDIPLDDELHAALPEGIRSFVQSIKATGKLAFKCPSLKYRTTGPRAGTDATQPAPASRMEFQTHVELEDGSLDVGVPLTDVNGSADLALIVQDGSLYALSGRLDIPALQIAYRDMRNLRGEIHKPPRSDLFLLKELHGKLAGGDMVAERIEILTPKDAAPTYFLRLGLRDVDVAQLSADPQSNIKGRLSGHLDLGGNWTDPNSRVGRGEAQIQGKDLYQLPAMFGLLQVANLALPIDKPFNEATANYTIQGQKITFEQIVLRTPNMLMRGDASLDFNTRRVRMTFIADNPHFPKIPVVGDIINLAKHELLSIEGHGTIEELRVEARPMNTFRTTIDEVFKSSKRK